MSDDAGQVPDLPTAAVPDLVSLDAVDACQLVRQAGLVPCGPEEAPAPETGVVLGQEPAAGTASTVGASVVLHTDPGRLAPD